MQVLECEVKNGIATIKDAEGKEISVTDAVLLCVGKLDSSGKLIISESGAFYVVNTQPDLQFLMDQVKALSEQVVAMSKVMVSRSPDTSPLAPDVTTAVEQIKAEIDKKALI